MPVRRLLFVNNSGGWGGAEKILYVLLKHLDRTRFEARVVLGEEGILADKIRDLGFDVMVLASTPWPASGSGSKLHKLALGWRRLKLLLDNARQVRQLVRACQPDLVHANNQQSITYCTLALLGLQTRLFWHEHTIQPSPMRRLCWDMLGKLRANRIITVSRAMAAAHGPGLGSKLSIIHNGLEAREGAPSETDLRARFDLPANAIVVTIPAVLRPWKGHRVFLHAAALVAATTPDAYFLVVGDETLASERGYKAQLVTLAHELGLADRCRFVGFQHDVPSILQQSDIVVSASTETDPLPTIVLEAMREGCAVVASAVGGVAEMVVHAETGMLVPANDAPAMGEAIERLIQDPALRMRLAQAGRERFEKEFTVTRFIEQIHHLYQSA